MMANSTKATAAPWPNSPSPKLFVYERYAGVCVVFPARPGS